MCLVGEAENLDAEKVTQHAVESIGDGSTNLGVGQLER